MSQAKPHQARSYDVGRTLLGLREKLALTQAELGTLLGVSRRSVQKWEGGEAYPSGHHLRLLLAVVLTHDGFTRDHERAEAEALWEQVNADAARRLGEFDAAWFDQLVAQRDGTHVGTVAPAATTIAPVPLPAPVPLIGRDRELADIAQLLANPACRVLTVTGPGGVGKTRLALEVAARHAPLFAHGAAWVELATTAHANRLPLAIGEALRLPLTGASDPAEQLLRLLEPLEVLLVLEHVDHVLDGIALISAVVQRAPRITVLATSRERLNLQTEWLFELDGLAYPTHEPHAATAPLSYDQAASYGAVRLFLQHAQRVHLHFSPSGRDLQSIIDICRYLTGLPLAIELAAAWARMLPIPAIERHIHTDLDVLATTQRDVPARHRSLRAVFNRAWAELNEREQRLFARLAVFRGTFSAPAAGRIVGASTPELAALYDKSLLRQVRLVATTPADADALWFSMLELIRAYALEQLTASGELATIRWAHARYFLEQVEHGMAQDSTTDGWLEYLDRIHDNLRAALRCALDEGAQAFGLRLAEALWLYWRRRGYLYEGRQWLAELLTLQPSDAPVSHVALAPGDAARAWLASDEHSFAQAVAVFAQGVSLQRNLGQADGLTGVLISGARRARVEGAYARATALLEQEAAQCRARIRDGTAHDGMLVPVLQELAMVQREQGRYESADELWQECLALQHANNDREGIAVAHMGLSDVARDRGDAAAVRELCTPSLEVFEEIGEARGIGYCLNNLALAALMDGDVNGAAMLSEDSVTLFREMEGGPSLAEVLVTRGRINTARGRLAEARDDLREAVQIAHIEGPRWQLAAAMEALGELRVQQRSEHALPLLSAATALRTAMGAPVRAADRSGFDHAVAAIRATLGDAAFTQAWAESATVSLDRIIADGLAKVADVSGSSTSKTVTGV